MKKLQLIKPTIDEREILAVTSVLRSGWLTEGSVTRQFEEKFAKYVGTKYAIATTSCTTALEATLKLLGIEKGHHVVVPDFSHPATADVVRLVGATPILVDVSLNTYNIVWEEVEKARRKFKIDAIIPVSWGGYPLDRDVVSDFENDGCKIIEDSACSHGSSFKGVMSGSIGVAGCFSFHPRKVITTGEGGMITTDDDKFAKDVKIYKSSGALSGQFVTIGSNLRMSNVLAAIGLEQLLKLDGTIAKRIELAKIYNELLKGVDWAIPPMVESEVRHNYQTYAIRLLRGNRDEIIQRLKTKNIETQIGTYALHLQPSFASEIRIGTLENSEKLYRNLLTLPMCYDMDYHDQLRVVNELKELIERK